MPAPTTPSTGPSAPRSWRRRTRRSVLAATGGVLAGAGLAGCRGGDRSVAVLAAGSLQAAFGRGLQARTDADLQVEAHGSARVARMVAEGQRSPDIVALADPALFGSVLAAEWYATFASNELVLAYNPSTAAGRRVRDADPWFAALAAPDASVTVGRTDPDLDPLGYRTLFALRLAAARADRPGLPAAVLAHGRIFPETQLLARFETGAVDAAVVYRSMAVERDYPFRELPAAVDLGDPARAGAYRTVSYDLPGGTTVRGKPIRYAAHLRSERGPATRAFETLLGAAEEYLSPHGFVVHDEQPTYTGDVPPSLRA